MLDWTPGIALLCFTVMLRRHLQLDFHSCDFEEAYPYVEFFAPEKDTHWDATDEYNDIEWSTERCMQNLTFGFKTRARSAPLGGET
jgi:hypothetical protein